MNPADIQVRLRPRAGWEAVDLGCALVRRFARPVWLAWITTVLPVQLLVIALLWNHPLVALCLLWFFKPAASRVVLQVLSRALFGQHPRLSELWRTLPKLWFRGQLRMLLTQRFSPLRSFNLPLFQLEGELPPERRKHRLHSLQTLSTTASGLTWTALSLESVLAIGLFTIAMMFIPEAMYQGWTDSLVELGARGFVEQDAMGLRRTLALLLVLTMGLLEPFYTGAGFLLYLNARTILEGWDIELSFRRLQERLGEINFQAPAAHLDPAATPPTLPPPGPAPRAFGPPRGLAPLIALALITFFSFSPPALAQTLEIKDPSLYKEPAPDSSYAADPALREEAQGILDKPEFEVFSQKIYQPSTPEISPAVGAAIGLVFVIQVIVYALIALAIIGGIVWVIIKLANRDRGPAPSAPMAGPRQRVTQLAGLDLRPESLPTDLIGAARAAWAQGDQREALALLYRGSLAWLLTRAQLPIAASDTEGDCLRRVKLQPNLGQILPWFRRMTAAWLQCAYNHEPPSSQAFEELCAQWPFAAPTLAAPQSEPSPSA